MIIEAFLTLGYNIIDVLTSGVNLPSFYDISEEIMFGFELVLEFLESCKSLVNFFIDYSLVSFVFNFMLAYITFKFTFNMYIFAAKKIPFLNIS